MMRRRMSIRIIGARRSHVDGARVALVAVGERRAALATERAQHRRRRLELVRLAAREAETLERKRQPADHRRAGNFPASLAVAQHAARRRAFGAVADRATEAAA